MDLICKPFLSGHIVLPSASNDPIVQSYLQGETPNDYMLAALEQTTVAGDLVLDLGSHVGTFTIGAALKGRSTISVDADPLHVDLVKKSLAINSLDGVVLQRAISSSEESISFIRNGLYGMIDYAGEQNGFKVETIGVDEVVSRFAKGRKVRFFKMDIEGAEMQALTTAERLLAEDQPVLWWESNGPNLTLSGSSIGQVRDWLENRGYRTFRVHGERFVYAPPDQIQPEAWLDVVSLPDRLINQWESMIDWTWDQQSMLAYCRHWLQFEHCNILKHLMAELDRLPQSDEVMKMKVIGKEKFDRLAA